MLHGAAGTGKTFIALYKALEEVMDKSNSYEKVVIVRSVVPSREIGHLPGDEKEKTDVYLAPYKAVCKDLFNTEQAYERLVEQKNIEFLITSFVRGITIDNAVIIVDECQNMNFQELSSIITRVGEGSRIVFCGDFKQTDLNKRHDQSGLREFVEVINRMPSFRNVEFGIDDIVRSSLVKEFIVANLHIQTVKS
jgi:predicted ribonuclease YlaK